MRIAFLVGLVAALTPGFSEARHCQVVTVQSSCQKPCGQQPQSGKCGVGFRTPRFSSQCQPGMSQPTVYVTYPNQPVYVQSQPVVTQSVTGTQKASSIQTFYLQPQGSCPGGRCPNQR